MFGIGGAGLGVFGGVVEVLEVVELTKLEARAAQVELLDPGELALESRLPSSQAPRIHWPHKASSSQLERPTPGPCGHFAASPSPLMHRGAWAFQWSQGSTSTSTASMLEPPCLLSPPTPRTSMLGLVARYTTLPETQHHPRLP